MPYPDPHQAAHDDEQQRQLRTVKTPQRNGHCGVQQAAQEGPGPCEPDKNRGRDGRRPHHLPKQDGRNARDGSQHGVRHDQNSRRSQLPHRQRHQQRQGTIRERKYAEDDGRRRHDALRPDQANLGVGVEQRTPRRAA